ncbi:MAG: MiaB/RimO family radical SAM methylthiotransferase, partial [Kiritimatiellia bacterium]|nr:MiaB/RimO family radical SAM methylthiotransferase [Kiritimatiellia bacterium]
MNRGDGHPRRFRVHVLGCKVNQGEARQIERRLEQAGLRPAEPDETPDLVVLHTCAVTAEAQRQSAQSLRKFRAQTPGASLWLSGCGAGPGLIESACADVVLPAGPDWNERLTAALSRIQPKSEDSIPILTGFGSRIRAFLKIQDGCDYSCSYCIVPQLRGPSRDRAVPEILDEARALISGGCGELVVTGISIGLFGRNSKTLSLPRLLERLTHLPGLLRLRISSLHPAELTPELLAVWRERRSILMPHLHLPLQSGSDRILRKMKRGYTVSGFLRAMDRARRALGDPAFHTDVIAGFPGETEQDAEATERLVQAAGFERLHVFPYSARPGT